jgi:hypothetical protein
MPLYVRKSTDHYPDRSPRLGAADTDHVVLCGNLVAGLIERITHGPSGGHWHWGVSLGDGLVAGGRTDAFEACKVPLGAAFRDLLARAGLAEQRDARAGPPQREPPSPADQSTAGQALPVWSGAEHPVVIHQLGRFTVHSGELLIGLITELDRVPWVGHWNWAISGTRPNPPGFVWRGNEKALREARAAHAAAWEKWLAWAGLEQKEPTRWQSA